VKFSAADLKPLACMVAVIIADQLSKLLIVSNFRLYESKSVIPGLFNLVYFTNTGAAFGFLAGDSVGWRQLFFSTVAVLALAGLFLSYGYFKRQGALYPYAITCIAGGAVGNLVDRVRLGSVIDFLDFYFKEYHWPAFNFADSAICVGVGLFLLASFLAAGESAASDQTTSNEESL